MKVFVLETPTVIEPFGDRVGDCLILDRPLRERMSDELRALPATVTPVSGPDAVGAPTEPYLVTADTLFSTTRLLREFVEKARLQAGDRPARLWVKRGLFTRVLSVVQETEQNDESIAFSLWYVPRGPFTPETAVPVSLDVDEDSYEGNFPRHMLGKESYKFCVTSRPVVNITHPLHLALANMAANFARLGELKRMSLWGKLYTVLKARSINKFRVLSALSQIHPEAEVHPTAVVEGSIVEKGAKIGAYAVVRFSFVGEKAFIDDHAGLKFSIVGREAYVANNCVLFFSVVYPRAFLISGPYQFTLFGYDSAMMNSIPSDYRLDAQPISIKTSKGLVSTGLRFVGSVIGHRTKIAAGIIIAPGRVIPNDLYLFPDPARVLTQVPADIPRQVPLFLQHGRLVTLAQLTPPPGESPSTGTATGRTPPISTGAGTDTSTPAGSAPFSRRNPHRHHSGHSHTNPRPHPHPNSRQPRRASSQTASPHQKGEGKS
jgi:carbonic anhydrase/acetyltransferase-like protein (isoleucine patch superfamily)